MKFIQTKIKEVILIEPRVFTDDRGYFFECYHKEKYHAGGITVDFVQDNQSQSVQGTLRGLHYQAAPMQQAKLVRAVSGTIFDVAVDIRKGSPTYGQWVGELLSAENKKLLYIPEDFAHGFYVLSETAEIHYKCSRLYSSEHDRAIRWDDPTIHIKWPLLKNTDPILSEKDRNAPDL